MRSARRWHPRFKTPPIRAPGIQFLLISTLLLALQSLAACQDDSDTITDGRENYYEYWIESLHFDPASERVTVHGLYGPYGSMTRCLLPASEVRHSFTLGVDGWTTVEAATPIPEGFEGRVAEVVAQHPSRQELVLPGRGTIWALHWTYGVYPDPADLVLPCTTVGFLLEDQLEVHRVELRCGYCVEQGCGNDICDPGEDWYSCQRDCPPPITVCGDGTCDGTEYEDCRPDCSCTNASCYDYCQETPGSGEYCFCGATDSSRWSGCSGGWYNTPCDGSEPFCDPDDHLVDIIVYCDQIAGARARLGCNQLCYEAYGTGGGYCDLGGTEDCVCQDGISPW